jgi:hypothetical protein
MQLTMAETAIKSNQREAARLFERGVAAARGGQRRVAAGLLARVVQLDPRHELGWLWLSGVLDDPNEIAFCLRAVLAVNPHNERARQGLAWLEQRGQIAAQPAPPAVAEPAPVSVARAEAPEEHQAQESWWVGWRHSRREMSRARLVFWSVPILLLALTLALNIALRDAVGRNQALALAAAQPKIVSTAAPALPSIIDAEVAPVRDAQVLAYLSAIEAPRAQLRDAINAYRNSTGQPGGSSVTHAGAARALREQIDKTYGQLEAIEPPATLAQAHNSYLAGLEIERQALDDMLEFYNSLSVQYANRATLRMVDSGRQLDRARSIFDARRLEVANQPIQPQVAR